MTLILSCDIHPVDNYIPMPYFVASSPQSPSLIQKGQMQVAQPPNIWQ